MTTKLILISLACLLAICRARTTNTKYLHASSRIMGGEDARPGEFPHQVSLQWGLPPLVEFKYVCGGSIIDKQWILTAAHCLEFIKRFSESGVFIVEAGKRDLKVRERGEQVSLIESYFIHEKYRSGMEAGPYDIGLIKLSRPLHYSDQVAPISLPKKNTEPTGTVILSGWGALTGDKHAKTPRMLQRTFLKIADRSSCNQAFYEAAEEVGLRIEEDLVDETNICTRSLTGKTASCQGDSGGPLIKKDDSGNTELVGVVSWGMVPCNRKGAPGVYVKVSSFIDWIENIISKNRTDYAFEAFS